MSKTIGRDEWVAMLRAAADAIRANHELLSNLDSVGGDGDHGTTMVRAMAVMEKALDEHAAGSAKDLLHAAGWAILGVDGGATGPLLGTFLMTLSEGATDALDAGALATAFDGALAGVRRQTKAQPGDKTMLDALVPAVESLRANAETGPGTAMKAAAEAAVAGAESTKAMQARFGRARNIKEQSIGTQDPGATSMSLIFRGFAEALATP